jgi:hypothetical protein
MPILTVTAFRRIGGMPVISTLEEGDLAPESSDYNAPWLKALEATPPPCLWHMPDKSANPYHTKLFRPGGSAEDGHPEYRWISTHFSHVGEFPCTFTPYIPEGPQPD